MSFSVASPSRRVTAALAAAAMALAVAPLAQAIERAVAVVVTAAGSAEAARAVLLEGGTVDAELSIVDGVSARVSPSRLANLSRRVRSVVADRPLRTQGASYEDGLANAYPIEAGAPQLWARGKAGGSVAVAIVDTGVADVADLRDRLIARADVSGEGNGLDGYGHGTFLAGLVAGDGTSSNGRYVGVAPKAGVVSVKVAGADGSTSLSRVLLGVQIARASAERFGTRVLLLALSSESPLPPDVDPLSIALRRVWASGILVVVPAGNDGPAAGSIASPGEDPVLFTVGSVDDRGTGDVFDDAVSPWSARGETRWGDPKPDAAAPGEHLIGLRAPGSAIDVANPGSVVERSYFRGSGTSMSAAVAAGAAALLFDARPELDADQAKAMLMGAASPIPAGDAASVGAGVVNAAAAASLEAPGTLPPIPQAFDPPPAAVGAWTGGKPGSWEFSSKAQGKDAASAADTQEQNLAAITQWAGRQWEGRQWEGRQWEGRQWEGRQWEGRQWAGRQWAGRQWAYAQWLGRQWESRQWAGRQWAGRQWSATVWGGRQWTESDWLGRQWSGRQWSDQEWMGRQWSGRQWSGRQWTGRQWSAATWA